ncbi:MAG: AlpA family phage regulatory protein [Bacteroidia bacterium]|nr:AlpA family phage regulatory protein [Bacteroidia bacterium]
MTNRTPPNPYEIIIAEINKCEITAALLVSLNGYVSQKTVEHLSTLSSSEIYRRQQAGKFPQKVDIGNGQRKAFRIRDVCSWLENPTGWNPNE